uniref:Mitochondrial transcription termination factor 2 n=1 Tax=Callorhinchus milii TaxID=7868 RepID=A0A4W3ITC8_CALMI
CLRSLTLSLQWFSTSTALTLGRKENKLTVDSLHQLSVDITKIRKLKSWVLFEDTAYVSEIAKVLKEMGAERTAITTIFEQCPEAVLCTPTEAKSQRELWRTVCPNEKKLVKIIERFPDSFFTVKNYTNRRANVEYLQELNLNKRVISRLMASAPQTFCGSVDKNRAMIETLQESYLRLGGAEANAKAWLQKLLSQDPFILLKSPAVVSENLALLHKMKFSRAEVLSLLSRLRGFVSELSPKNMEKSRAFSKERLRCNDEELNEMILKCPALLYYSVLGLEERLNTILLEGFSVSQIKRCPTVLELTTQIVQDRIRKLNALGFDVKKYSLELLDGTKKEFEISCGKINTRKKRPLFNPVAPLNIEE